MRSLSDKHNIELGSKWRHKDGGLYAVLDLKHIDIGFIRLPVLLYAKILSFEDKQYFTKNKIKNQFVRTVEHFKNSFERVEDE